MSHYQFNVFWLWFLTPEGNIKTVHYHISTASVDLLCEFLDLAWCLCRMRMLSWWEPCRGDNNNHSWWRKPKEWEETTVDCVLWGTLLCSPICHPTPTPTPPPLVHYLKVKHMLFSESLLLSVFFTWEDRLYHIIRWNQILPLPVSFQLCCSTTTEKPYLLSSVSSQYCILIDDSQFLRMNLDNGWLLWPACGCSEFLCSVCLVSGGNCWLSTCSLLQAWTSDWPLISVVCGGRLCVSFHVSV